MRGCAFLNTGLGSTLNVSYPATHSSPPSSIYVAHTGFSLTSSSLAHFDGCFTTLQVRPHEPEQRTFLTLQVYLRSSNDLEGGATRFFSQSRSGQDGSEFYDIEAVPGRVLIFQHRDLLHSGSEVIQGEKIALRSDILYRQIE